jgi:hypothetical protein
VSRARRQGTAQPTALHALPVRCHGRCPYPDSAGRHLTKSPSVTDRHCALRRHARITVPRDPRIRTRRCCTDHDRHMVHGCDRPSTVASTADPRWLQDR